MLELSEEHQPQPHPWLVVIPFTKYQRGRNYTDFHELKPVGPM